MQIQHDSSRKSYFDLSRTASRLVLLGILAAASSGLLPMPPTRAGRVKVPPASHVVSLPYYSTKDGWDSVLTLNNATHSPLTAALTLYSLDGSALPLPDLSLGPDLHAALRISDLITNAQAGRRFKKGSVELRFNGESMDLGAQLTVSDAEQGLSFDMEPPMGLKSSTLEGLWWSPDSKTSGQVMLSNTTSGTLDVLMNVEWRGDMFPTPPIFLSAHQTVVLEIEDLLKGVRIKSKGIGRGGLSITHSGSSGALIAHGVVQNKQTGFASNLTFIDPAARISSVLHGTGLMLARPASLSVFRSGAFFEPVLALKNRSAVPQTAAVTIQYTVAGQAHSQSLPVVNLASHDVRMVDFSPFLSSLAASRIDDAGLKIESSGVAGTLIAQLTSSDQNGKLCVDVPLMDVGPNFIGTGAHPFHLEGDSQAVVHLKNLAAEPTTAIVQVLYDGGEFSPELVRLGPEQSVSVDLRQLRDSHGKDVHGHQLPAEFTRGQVQWFQHGKQRVIGRLVASSPSVGVSASFACGGVCCPPSFYSFNVTPGSLDGIPEDEFGLTMTETDYTCGQFYGPFNITGYVTCTSTDPSVAGAYGTTIEMEDEGTATINIDHWAATFERTNFECDSGGCEPNCVETDNLLRDALTALVRIPNHLKVLDDQVPLTSDACPSTIARTIVFQIVDIHGTPIHARARLKEKYIMVSHNTCENGEPVAFSCTPYADNLGQFPDHLDVNCNSVGGSCGYDLHWQWQWCPVTRAALPLGTLEGHVHNDEVKVNGTTSMPGLKGREIFP